MITLKFGFFKKTIDIAENASIIHSIRTKASGTV